MKNFSLFILLNIILLGGCRQSPLEGTGLVTDNGPVFYFRGNIGDSVLNIEAGRNYFFTTKPIISSGDWPGTGLLSNDERAFTTGCKYLQNNGGGYYRLMLLFCLPATDSLHVGVYPVATANPLLTGVYSYGKAAARLYDVLESNTNNVSYTELNTAVSGQFIEITKIEPYSEPGITGKKISYRLNMRLYSYPRSGGAATGSKLMSGEGVALLYQ
jgi:hypothetical protein